MLMVDIELPQDCMKARDCAATKLPPASSSHTHGDVCGLINETDQLVAVTLGSSHTGHDTGSEVVHPAV